MDKDPHASPSDVRPAHDVSRALRKTILQEVLPELAEGLLAGRRDRSRRAAQRELDAIGAAATSVLYRLLFLLYAQSRGLLPRGDVGVTSCFADEGVAEGKLPEACLTRALDALARAPNVQTGALEPIDYAALPVRELGTIHEELLAYRLRRTPAGLRLERHGGGRKGSGSFYTPAHIVDFIVEQTLGPLLQRHFESLRPAVSRLPGDAAAGERTAAAIFEVKILDPAMGSGHFLVAAMRFLTAGIAGFLRQCAPSHVRALLEAAVRGGGVPGEPVQPDLDDAQLIALLVATRCIHGVDLDRRAVDLGKMSLWLTVAAPGVPLSSFDRTLKSGNALSLPWKATFPDVWKRPAGGFDAVIGNPPYGLLLRAREKRRLRQSGGGPHAYNVAAAFIHEALTRLAPSRTLGLVVPKSLVYSRGWRATLDEVFPHLEALIDASESFDGVLLEQVVIRCATGAGPSYEAGTFIGGACVCAGRIDKGLRTITGSAVTGLTPAELALGLKIAGAGTALADLVLVDRGGPWQRLLRADGDTSVVGGKAIGRYRIDPARAARMSAADMDPRRLREDRQPKIVVQNIIAHIQKPGPHIRIIAAWDGAGTITLDTVNRLFPRHGGVVLEHVLGLLNSKLASWFAWRFIYSKAVRTMHFDRAYVGRLRLPPLDGVAGERLCALVRAAIAAPSPQALAAIDALLYQAFRLTPDEVELVERSTFHE